MRLHATAVVLNLSESTRLLCVRQTLHSLLSLNGLPGKRAQLGSGQCSQSVFEPKIKF